MKANKNKKVLIAVDYDPSSKKVAEIGFSLAKSMGAEVILLHVISDPIYYASLDSSPIVGFSGYMEMGPTELINVDGLLKASRHFLEKFKHQLGDETIQTIVKEGDYAETIIKTATELHADIIAIGTHGRKWLEKIVMGSVTEKVLNHTTIPLFIIPTKKQN